ncbi:MAG: ABC transporter permease [Planctomycetota bacterium]
MLATLTIARNALTESLRQPIFLVIILLCGLLEYLTTAAAGFSMGYNNLSGEVTGDDKLLLELGLSTVFICGIVLAAFVATNTISEEIENKTVLTIVSKPVSRASVVVGKYLGVSVAMLIGITIMVLSLMFAIQHGVMSTAADDVDWPIILFGGLALLLSLGLASFGNFMYGWSFPQTAVLTLLPLTILAYVLSVFFTPDWEIQSPAEEFKPQVTLAALSIAVALLVMTSVAVAASTRLGQVMTIVACLGVLVLGLLTNHFLGRHAFLNEPFGSIATSTPVEPTHDGLRRVGDEYRIRLEVASEREIRVGDPFYFAPAPNGVGMVTPGFDAPAEGTDLSRDVFGQEVAPALVVTRVEGSTLTVRQVGRTAVPISRAPERGDWCFTEPQETRPVALVAWALVPNMHAFWLVDAVTQVNPIPASHFALVLLYAGGQIVVFLGAAVLLFQDRDMG